MRTALSITLLLTVLPVLPAHARASCPPSGGAAIPAASPADGDFSITGRGFGHGVGMSQWGARGAAKLGCTASEILATYYPGTTLVTSTSTTAIRVGLAQATTTATVTAVSGPLAWEHCAETCEPLRRTQAQDEDWTVTVQQDGAYVVSSGAEEVFRGGDAFTRLRAHLDGTVARLDTTGHRYRWGALELQGGAGEAGEAMTVVADIASMEQYLYGLSEVPSSWEAAVLHAQAVAGRTYALSRRLAYNGNRTGCRCDVYATVRDQAYTGYEKESEGPDAVYGKRWVAAVDATAGTTARYEGRPIEAFYASSHGGYSETSAFVFGGSSLPYLEQVDDTRWEVNSGNPNLTWRVGVTAEKLGEAAGVGIATRVTLPEPKGFGGRIGDPARGAGGVRVEGTQGTATLSGPALRTRLGLRSALFDIVGRPGTQVARIAGRDRVETAVAVSARGWDTAGEVLLATAAGFPDALAAGPLAARLDAPLLLTDPLVLPDAVRAELHRLRAERVTILGGTNAVSPVVEEQLKAAGFTTRRLRGDSRYATAAAVAGATGAPAGGEVLLVLGDDWPDAVAAGALTLLASPPPMLLAQRDMLPDPTLEALRALRPTTVLLVGGTGALSAGVEERLRAEGYATQRLSGPTRWATSSAVAHEALRRVPDEVSIVFASGQNFPDALAAGPFAARRDATLLLVPRDDLTHAPPSHAFMRDHAPRLADGFLVGGAAAVSERVREQLSALL